MKNVESSGFISEFLSKSCPNFSVVILPSKEHLLVVLYSKHASLEIALEIVLSKASNSSLSKNILRIFIAKNNKTLAFGS